MESSKVFTFSQENSKASSLLRQKVVFALCLLSALCSLTLDSGFLCSCCFFFMSQDRQAGAHNGERGAFWHSKSSYSDVLQLQRCAPVTHITYSCIRYMYVCMVELTQL